MCKDLEELYDTSIKVEEGNVNVENTDGTNNKDDEYIAGEEQKKKNKQGEIELIEG